METGRETGLDERRLMIGSDKSFLREELLEKAKDTVENFLADMDAKIIENDNLYLHCNLLIRTTIDTKLEEFIQTIQTMESDIASAYDIFENKCYPIMAEKIAVPAPILARSQELLHENDVDSDQYNKETTTVFEYERQIGRAVSFMLADEDPEIVGATLDFDGGSEFEYGIDFRLDFERDTIEEVMSIVNLFPEALDDEDDEPPQVTNNISLRSVSFIPTLISLWMKYCNRQVVKVDGHDEYGLVCYNLVNPLLVDSYDYVYNYHHTITRIFETGLDGKGEEKQRLFDEQCAVVLKWFVDKGIVVGSVNFFAEANILTDNYINVLLENNNSIGGSCIGRRLQVLLDLCPAVLEIKNNNNPLFTAAKYSPIGQYESFISVLMAGIHTSTTNNGIISLFRIIHSGDFHTYPRFITPFAKFINRWPNKKEEKQKRLNAIHNALNDPILCRHHPPYDTAQAIFEAATKIQISLDGVYFLLRREPDVLQKLLLRGNDSNNDNRTIDNANCTTKRNGTAAPNNISTNDGLIPTKKTKTK